MSQVTEQELQAKAVAPRVTKAQIDALLARVSYRFEQPKGTTSTFCHAYLDDRFYLASGHSACVSLENYNQEIGERIARGNTEAKATSALWELEGYALYKALNPDPTTFLERLELEYQELSERLGKLKHFLTTEVFAGLDELDRFMLERQAEAMTEYSDVLSDRLIRARG